MWDLIVSVPDYCLSFYFETLTNGVFQSLAYTRKLGNRRSYEG